MNTPARIETALQNLAAALDLLEAAWEALGAFHITDVRRGSIMQTNVDIEALGRAIGALQPFEKLED